MIRRKRQTEVLRLLKEKFGKFRFYRVSAFRERLHEMWLDTRVTKIELLDESGHGKHVEVG